MALVLGTCECEISENVLTAGCLRASERKNRPPSERQHHMNTKVRNRVAIMGIAAAAAGVVLATAGGSAQAAAAPATTPSTTVAANSSSHHPVKIEVFAPERHDVAGDRR